MQNAETPTPETQSKPHLYLSLVEGSTPFSIFFFLDEYSTQHYAAYFAGKNNIELIYGFLEFC